METKAYRVRFTVQYEIVLHVVEGESLEDAVSDIDIPESDTCTYVADTFSPDEINEVPATPETMKHGIAYTDDGSPTGIIVGWSKYVTGEIQLWDNRADALEANDMDGWRGYVREYPTGTLAGVVVQRGKT